MKMKRLRYMFVSIVCLISGVLILLTSFHKDKNILTDSQVAVNEGRDVHNSIMERPKEVRQNDGLLDSAQIPRDDDLVMLNATALLQIYWKYINMLQILCKDVRRVGDIYDGGKEICFDPDYTLKAPCLVYSFGINNFFGFDRKVVLMFGCDVHCFDPSMKNETKQISEHLWFYRWGLGGRNEVNSKEWTIKTLDTIRKDLGHTNRTIDLLKIDIEGNEWNVIPQMISSGALDDVRQIAMETHFSTKHANKRDYLDNLPQYKQLSSLRQLYDFGYRIFMRDRNLGSVSKHDGIKGLITTVNEISMIKPHQ